MSNRDDDITLTTEPPEKKTEELDESKIQRADLIVLTGALAGRRFVVEARTLIGRDANATIQVLGDDVSRRHAAISRTNVGEFVIEDLKSRNGTLVNGTPVEVHVLRFGDKIQIGGKTLFVFTSHQAVEEQLVRWQRIELISQMTSGLIHDFNNYITAILGYIHYIQELSSRDISEDEFRDGVTKSLEVMESAAWEGVNLTRKVLGFARGAEQPRSPVLVGEILEEAVRLVRRSCEPKITIEVAVEPELRVLGNRTELLQVLVNLCLNARDAMPAGGELRLEAAAIGDLATPEGAVIRVKDTGVGMDEETRRRAFEPLFTTKAAGKGTGLGLPTVARLVENHRGHIDLETAPGKGTTFAIHLPAVAQGAIAQSKTTLEIGPPVMDEEIARAGGFVLLVDDQELVRQRARRALRPMGLDVLCVGDAKTALDLYATYHARIRLVVLNLDMELDAEETYRRLRAVAPEVRVLITSGTGRRPGSLLDEVKGVLQWPCDTKTFSEAISEALRR
jgi:signal transduction histidine kinase/CheY-like chemotaxis protein